MFCLCSKRVWQILIKVVTGIAAMQECHRKLSVLYSFYRERLVIMLSSPWSTCWSRLSIGVGYCEFSRLISELILKLTTAAGRHALFFRVAHDRNLIACFRAWRHGRLISRQNAFGTDSLLRHHLHDIESNNPSKLMFEAIGPLGNWMVPYGTNFSEAIRLHDIEAISEHR